MGLPDLEHSHQNDTINMVAVFGTKKSAYLWVQDNSIGIKVNIFLTVNFVLHGVPWEGHRQGPYCLIFIGQHTLSEPYTTKMCCCWVLFTSQFVSTTLKHHNSWTKQTIN